MQILNNMRYIETVIFGSTKHEMAQIVDLTNETLVVLSSCPTPDLLLLDTSFVYYLFIIYQQYNIRKKK